MSLAETKSRVLYLRLLRYVTPYWRMFALAILTMVLVAATEPLFPALMKPLLDGSFVNKDPTTIRYLPFALVGLFLVRGVFGFASDYALSWVSNRWCSICAPRCSAVWSTCPRAITTTRRRAR